MFSDWLRLVVKKCSEMLGYCEKIFFAIEMARNWLTWLMLTCLIWFIIGLRSHQTPEM